MEGPAVQRTLLGNVFPYSPFSFAAAFLFPGLAQAQGPPRGFWPQADSDSAHSNWQKAGTEITPETVSKGSNFVEAKARQRAYKITILQRAPTLSRPDHRPRLQRHGALGRRQHLILRRLRTGRTHLEEGLPLIRQAMWKHPDCHGGASGHSLWHTPSRDAETHAHRPSSTTR